MYQQLRICQVSRENEQTSYLLADYTVKAIKMFLSARTLRRFFPVITCQTYGYFLTIRNGYQQIVYRKEPGQSPVAITY